MVVVAPAVGVVLWHGGYTRAGLLAFAAVAAAGLALHVTAAGLTLELAGYGYAWLGWGSPA